MDQARAVEELWQRVRACTRCLEDRALALDRERYVPFPTVGLLPPGASQVRFVFVGWEPFDRWVKKAGSRSAANALIDAGRRNFDGGRDESCLQYAIEHWLLRDGEGYYFTDIAKCTISVALAGKTRRQRFDHCAMYLEEEIELLKPAAIIGVGREAYRYLRDHRRARWPAIFRILHYGAQAAGFRKQIAGDGWESQAPFADELDDFIEERRIARGRSDPTRTTGRAHRQLVAAYRRQFAAIRRMLDEGVFVKDVGAQVSVAPPAT